MKKILCIFTLLALACSVTVHAESKKDTKKNQTNFTEEQFQNISKSTLKGNSILAQELKTLLNEKIEELEENSTSPQNPAFKQTRIKTFFDNDKYGVQKYGETSSALLNTYKEKCGSNEVKTTDDIIWEVEKIHSENPIIKQGRDWLYFNEYDFSLQCPDGAVYLAHKICFETVWTGYNRPNLEKYDFHMYIDCDYSRIGEDLKIRL